MCLCLMVVVFAVVLHHFCQINWTYCRSFTLFVHIKCSLFIPGEGSSSAVLPTVSFWPLKGFSCACEGFRGTWCRMCTDYKALRGKFVIWVLWNELNGKLIIWLLQKKKHIAPFQRVCMCSSNMDYASSSKVNVIMLHSASQQAFRSSRLMNNTVSSCRQAEMFWFKEEGSISFMHELGNTGCRLKSLADVGIRLFACSLATTVLVWLFYGQAWASATPILLEEEIQIRTVWQGQGSFFCLTASINKS